jgi:hypothetical protein
MHVQTAASLRFEAFRDAVHHSDWRVEAINSASGDVFVRRPSAALLAQERATEYADLMNRTRN